MAGPALVQHPTPVVVGSTLNTTLAFAGVVNAGDLITVALRFGDIGETITVSDNVNPGNYTHDALQVLATDDDTVLLLSKIATVTGTPTLTFAANAAVSWQISIADWSPGTSNKWQVAAQVSAGGNSSSTSVNTGSVVTVLPNGLVLSIAGYDNSVNQAPTAAGSTALLDIMGGTGHGGGNLAANSGYQLVTSPGTYAGQFTIPAATEWGAVAAFYPVGAIATGAIVEGADAAAGSGTASTSGIGAIVESGDIVAGVGTAGNTGSGSIVEGSDTVAGVGTSSTPSISSLARQLGISGPGNNGPFSLNQFNRFRSAFAAAATSVFGVGAIVENGDTVSGSGGASVTGSGSITESADAVSGTGAQSVSGSGAITEAHDIVAGTGVTGANGTGSIVENADTVSGTGVASVSGVGSIVEGNDTVAGTGTAAGSLNGVGAIVENADTVAGVGAASVSGNGAIAEQHDTVAGSGFASVSGSGSVAESSDIVSGVGSAVQVGSGSIVESPDTANGSGSQSVIGIGSIIEGFDFVAGSGTGGQPQVGRARIYVRVLDSASRRVVARFTSRVVRSI